MTRNADTSDTLPDIQIKSPGEAVASLPGPADEAVLSALMVRALQAHADSLAETREAKTVSVSLDMTGKPHDGGEVQIRSEVDRQTRTIIFMGGELLAKGEILLKATAIFRLSDPD